MFCSVELQIYVWCRPGSNWHSTVLQTGPFTVRFRSMFVYTVVLPTICVYIQYLWRNKPLDTSPRLELGLSGPKPNVITVTLQGIVVGQLRLELSPSVYETGAPTT